jgi:hypothetical protein
MPEKRKPARNLATSVSEEPAMRAQGAPSMTMAWWWSPHASNSAAANATPSGSVIISHGMPRHSR